MGHVGGIILVALMLAQDVNSYEGACSLENTWNAEFRGAMVGAWRAVGSEERRFDGKRTYYESGRVTPCVSCCVETKRFDAFIKIDPPSSRGFVRQLTGRVGGTFVYTRGVTPTTEQNKSYVECPGLAFETSNDDSEVVFNFRRGQAVGYGGTEPQCFITIDSESLVDGTRLKWRMISPTALQRLPEGTTARVYRKQ